MSPEATEAAAITPAPQEVVQAFYDWYLTDQNYEHLLVRPELTPAFVEWLQAFTWEYNAIVCAQAVPESVQAGTAVISEPSATVPITISFSGLPGPPGQAVDLTLGPDGWKISAVNCGF